jgi:hypothetical protein
MIASISFVYAIATLWLVIVAYHPFKSWKTTIAETLLMALWPLWWAITMLYFVGYGIFIVGRMLFRKACNAKQSIQASP